MPGTGHYQERVNLPSGRSLTSLYAIGFAEANRDRYVNAPFVPQSTRSARGTGKRT
jgi:hypothetical protein